RKLEREVAIKVLPAHLTASGDALRRFEREAKAVAALSHPNILSIFDFGTQDGVAYAVTELLEGATLRERLLDGPLPQKLVADLGLQLAKGLSAAHERGVVHRDLKPENIFVTRDGHLKILDFGLAKKEERIAREDEPSAPAQTEHTTPGTVLGTVGYMSPEQVRGEPVDHRTDIFSFGAVLYEMLTGQKAFKRRTPGDTMAAILRDDLPALSGSGGGIAHGLDSVARHCVEKDRDQRFQSARDIAFALSELTGSASAPAELAAPSLPRKAPSRWLAALALGLAAIAAAIVLVVRPGRGVGAGPNRVQRMVVLPFESLGAPEDAYFAAGVTEEISSRLAGLKGLAVISRVTATGYDRRGKTIRQIGSDLGVDYVLEGAVRWDRASGREERVRITPELIQVSDDTRVWSDRYDRVIADVFEIQSEVAENVVRAMGVNVLTSERTKLKAVSTKDVEAYELYIR